VVDQVEAVDPADDQTGVLEQLLPDVVPAMLPAG
jgi:hypothetical protein